VSQDRKETPKPSHILVDNFVTGPDQKIWSLKRVEDSRIIHTIIDGRSALGISIQPGDKASHGTERAEISEKSDIQLPLNTDASYNFSILLPPDFSKTDNRLVLAQWKEVTTEDKSPFMSLRYVSGEMFFQINSDNDKQKFPISNNVLGRWMNLGVRYKISESGTGVCVVIADNREVINYSGAIGYRDSSENRTYFKMGLYRDAINESQTAYFANFRRHINFGI